MLQLVQIVKQYRTADLVQNALDGVTLNLRDREFVAILGPSGSGKTTLLNVIGGLDHYDSGDLIINGVSTNHYKDRDWDTYRNHSIGFVFQSYNLIPHQTILANVELALTISGMSVAGRKKRAKEALEKVGLAEHIHKRPSQLSGGQMQRVAIARALVNDPDIVLADEPTGALDSETSLQVMELLKEVARDRLVVMVTHNPDLADAYATRIVRIRDGKVTGDTDPFVPGVTDVKAAETAPEAQPPAGEESITAEAQAGAEAAPGGAAAGTGEEKSPAGQESITAEEPAAFTRSGTKKSKKKASMSFFTALALSFNNLRTKKARTILVAIAGSIGIIGIAMIQSLSNGVNDYISGIEENTVSQYPVSINSTGVNVAAYMAMFSELNESKTAGSDDITINQVLHNYAGGLTNNDLCSLKQYLVEESGIEQYARAVEYTYSVVPQIYRKEEGKIRRIHPDESLDSMGMRYEQVSMMNLVAFFQLPENDILYRDQYRIRAGHWPENDEECVVVLGSDGSITDITAYALGLKPSADLDEIVRRLMVGEDVVAEEDPGVYRDEDLMGRHFKVINSCNLYVYDEENGFWTDRTSGRSFLQRIFDEGRDLTVCGVVMEKEDTEGLLESGIYYTSSLVTGLIEEAAASEVVNDQLANRSVNIFNGKEFGESSDMDELNLEDLLTVDEEAVQKAFSFDMEGLELSDSMFEGMDMSSLDLSGMTDLSALSGISLSLPTEKIYAMFSSVSFSATPEELQALLAGILAGFATGENAEELVKLQAASDALSDYLQTDGGRAVIAGFVSQVVADAVSGITIDPKKLEEDPQSVIDEVTQALMGIQITDEQLQSLSAQLVEGFAAYFTDVVAPDIEKLLTNFSNYMSSEEVQQALVGFVLERLDTSTAEALFYEVLDEVSSDVAGQISSVVTTMITDLSTALAEALTEQITAGVESMTEELGAQMENLFSIDEKALEDAFQFKMSEDSVKDLFATMAVDASTSYENNLLSMGYADLDDPESIMIYSKDFESKGMILTILDDYNETMKDVDDGAKVVTYSDIAGTMMSSVSSIIGVISTVLICLVAISLVVSSIMIGVITYISVLERKKEIGILRALGASKRNVADVFNAETFITGLFAGILGVIVSSLLTIPANWVIHEVAGQPDISAYLDPRAAVLLVILSVLLNILAGFLPSRKASKSNPVTALRDE